MVLDTRRQTWPVQHDSCLVVKMISVVGVSLDKFARFASFWTFGWYLWISLSDLDLGKIGKIPMLLFLEGFPVKNPPKCIRPSQGTGGYFKHRHQCQLRSDLAARAPRFFFGGTRGLQAVQKLLKETRDKVQLVLQWVTWRYTLWWSTGAMENHQFLDEFPIFKGAFTGGPS